MRKVLLTKEEFNQSGLTDQDHLGHVLRSTEKETILGKIFPYPLYKNQRTGGAFLKDVIIRTWLYPSPFMNSNGEYLEFILFQFEDQEYWISLIEYQVLDTFCKSNVLETWGYIDGNADNSYTLWMKGYKKVKEKVKQNEY